VPHDVLMKTIERFWTEVMPRVAWGDNADWCADSGQDTPAGARARRIAPIGQTP